MGSVKDILVKIFTSSKTKFIVAAVSVVVFLFLLNRWNYNRYKEAKAEAQRAKINLLAAQDTIRVVKAKNNTVEYNKLSYIASDLKELKEINASLAKEVEITKGSVAAIQKIGFQIKHDSIYVPTTVYVEDSVFRLRSRIDSTYSKGNFRALAFESTYDARKGSAYSILTEDRIGFTATVGLKINDKKQHEIFVRPHYPGMEVGILEGAIIEENLFKTNEPKKRAPLITAGINAGWMPIAYNFQTGKVDVNLNRVGIGAGINININRLLGK